MHLSIERRIRLSLQLMKANMGNCLMQVHIYFLQQNHLKKRRMKLVYWEASNENKSFRSFTG